MLKLLLLEKINIFLVVCLLFSVRLNAQSIIIKDLDGKTVTGDTLEVVFHPGVDHGWTELTSRVFLKNVSNDSLEVGFKKKEFNLQADEYHSFCFAGNCVDSSTHVSPFHAIIAPGGIDSSFSGHFRFDDLLHVKNRCLVSYTFYNVKNTGDTAIVYVIYNTMLQTGVDESSKPNVFLSNSFPNPVNESLNINYSLKNTVYSSQTFLFISNTLGEFLKKQLLTQESGSLSINTVNWKPGMYYYFIFCGNVPIAFNKCIIIH